MRAGRQPAETPTAGRHGKPIPGGNIMSKIDRIKVYVSVDEYNNVKRLQKVLKWTGSKSVTLYRQTCSGSALKPLRGTTESGDLLVICPVRCAA